MPMPEGRRLAQNVSPTLTNMAIGFMPQNNFIARQVFPVVPVTSDEGTYNVLKRGTMLRPQGKKLANFEAAPIGGFAFDKDNYSVDEWGLASPWTDRELSRAQTNGMGAQNLIASKTRFVTYQALLANEIETAALVNNAAWSTVWQGGAAIGGGVEFIKFSDYAGSDPVGVIQKAIEAFRMITGMKPNKMILPTAHRDVLFNHPDIIDRIKFTGSGDQPARVNLGTLKELFGIPDIIVPESVYNSGNEGQGDLISDIWGTNITLLYTPPAPSIEDPSAGYHFNWTGQQGFGPQPFQTPINDQGMFIRRYTTDRPAAYWIESRYYSTPRITAADLGMRLETAI